MLTSVRCTLTVAALAIAVPATAQDVEPRNTLGLPAPLQAIDDVLTGGLLNDPTSLQWDGYGADLSKEIVQDESYPGGGAAVRVTMARAGEVHAGGINVPLLAPVENGERVTVGFFGRAISSGAADGMGKVQVRFQQNAEPYPGFGETMVNLKPEWDFYEVSTVANRDIARNGIVALQFGTAAQTVEIGQTIVVSGTATVVD